MQERELVLCLLPSRGLQLELVLMPEWQAWVWRRLQQTFFSSITFATTTLQAHLDVVTTTSSLLGRTVQPPQGQGRGESGLQSSVFRAGRSVMCDG